MKELVIRLMSDLCAGNGESVGYGIDSDICSDPYGFPYIPGKRITGCLRDAAEELKAYGYGGNDDLDKNIDAIFGNAYGQAGAVSIGNGRLAGVDAMHHYIEQLKQTDKDYLLRQSTEDRLIRLYSSVRGQTRIGDDGKAEDGTLRFIRVLNQHDPVVEEQPNLEFHCDVDISGLNEEQEALFENACKAWRHMGLNRNRGLGNVSVTLKDKAEAKVDKIKAKIPEQAERIRIEYQLLLDSPVTIQEYGESGRQIKAGTMIGVFASNYLKRHQGRADDLFDRLFLNGDVKWSALTPVINGIISDPAPTMLMKLKNDNGKLINSFVCADAHWSSKKPKSLEGFYAALDKKTGTYYTAQPVITTSYHNRIHSSGKEEGVTGLYIQDALKQGYIFGGTVSVPADLADTVVNLLNAAVVRLGRSKKTQYGKAEILSVLPTAEETMKIHIQENEPVFAILKSDLVLQKNTMMAIDQPSVRKAIAEQTGHYNEQPVKDSNGNEVYNDICRYHVLSGYNNMWHLQKPKIQAVIGGSVYCFKGKEGDYDSLIQIGEYQQEGMGCIEIVPFHLMQERQLVEKGTISVQESEENREICRLLENKLLFSAAMEQMNQYAFDYYKNNELNPKDIPCGRLRQMLIDAKDIADLWEMVDSMKTSDVSSESDGKKKNSKKLLGNFYGNDKQTIDFSKILKDSNLFHDIELNESVREKVTSEWKVPLDNLLHMIHYRKGRN